MNVTLVRLATEADHAAVKALYRELRPQDPEVGDPASLKHFCAVLHSPSARLVVALSDGVIGATCMLALLPNFANGGMPIGVIEHVVTGESMRRRGLARAALAFALDTAWTMNCCKVFLLSGAQRTDAHRLYESAGFVGDKELGFITKNPNGAPHD
jgi:GNAT superfamily N-acetyltransferase